MQKLYRIVFLLLTTAVFSQEVPTEVPNFAAVDSLYREDQFYFGITYNILKNKPTGVSQNSFSTGLNLGFLRDFPINKDRTIAIAPGLGFSFNNYKQNLIIQESYGTMNYSTIIPGSAFDKNKLALYFVDVPIEFRWRNSTYESHKFWRVYSGFKMSYLLLSQSRFIAQGSNFKVNNNPDINKFQYGAYLSVGYNSWNVYAYYGLQKIFKDAKLNGSPVDINTLNVGLMFYIL